MQACTSFRSCKKNGGGPFLGTPIIRIQDNSILVGIIFGGGSQGVDRDLIGFYTILEGFLRVLLGLPISAPP